VAGDDVVREQLKALGSFIRARRTQAEMSLRDLAARANVSNPYLSQVERGLHEPSVRVLKAIAGALDVSVDTLLARAGLLDDDGADHRPPSTEQAILADPALTDEQRRALLAVYRSYVEATARNRPDAPGTSPGG
jgi:transcriptional regulator with XRE-family HTH domain